MGSIQCDIQTEELPPQHAEVIYYDSGYVELSGRSRRATGETTGDKEDDKESQNRTELSFDDGSMMSSLKGSL